MSELKRKRPRRSNGCDACKARRMKCSGTRPKPCQECVKRGNGEACVYQINSIIFQSENAFVERSVKTSQRRKASSTNSTSNETTPHQARNDTSPSSSSDDDHKVADVVALQRRPRAHNTSKQQQQPIHIHHAGPDRWSSPDSSPAFILADPESRALSAFFSEYLPCEVVLSLHEHWLQVLKPALHNVPMLRNIVLAISRINVGSKYTDFWAARDNRIKAMEHYNMAVRQLQHSLEDPSASMTDNVLCAVTLFGVYELCKGTSPQSLQQHTAGGLSVIRARGPAAHATPGLAANIAAAFQGNELRQSIETGRKTFFAEPEWLAASRAWSPLFYNKWAGTELNVLMLRACNVLATDGYDMESARIILAEIRAERASSLGRQTDVLSTILEAQSIKAQHLQLHESPFGPFSVSYDQLQSGNYRSTLYAITSAWILLALYLSYPALLPSPNYGHEIMANMIQCIQYVIHDRKNHTGPVFYEVMTPLIDSIHWANSEDETNWIMHLLSTTGAPIMKQIGRLAEARVKQVFESAKMKELQIPVDGFLRNIGISQNVKIVTDDLEDDGCGYRSAICG